MFPAPQELPPNTSKPERTSGWPCLDRQIFPHRLLMLPIHIKQLAVTRQPFCTWEEVSLGISIAIPPQRASGQGLTDSEEHPGQDPVLMHSLE